MLYNKFSAKESKLRHVARSNGRGLNHCWVGSVIVMGSRADCISYSVASVLKHACGEVHERFREEDFPLYQDLSKLGRGCCPQEVFIYILFQSGQVLHGYALPQRLVSVNDVKDW